MRQALQRWLDGQGLLGIAAGVLGANGPLRPAATVFFGGGTPTLLPPGDLERMLGGVRETRGGAIGAPNPVQVHSVRMPGFVLSCEAVFGLADERLVIRHDAGTSAAPYVGGTLLAARRVGEQVGLRRGLDSLME